jgi:hypothetical protein
MYWLRPGLLAAALFGLAALFATCPMPMGKDWERNVDGNARGTGAEYIATYDLQAYVPIPTAGAIPVKKIENNRNIDITAVWKDGAGSELPESFNAFVRGAVYQAEITLTAKNGYVFDPEISFQYPEGAVDSQPGDDFSGEIRALSTVTYRAAEEPEYLSTVDLTFYIPFPFMGGTPVTSFYSGNYGGMVSWKIGSTVLAGLFQGRTVYQADANLYPGPGYVFSPDVQVIYQWEDASDEFAYDEGKVLGSIVFPATGDTAPGIGDYDVKDYDLQHYVPIPVAGGTPVRKLSRPDMKVTVEWQDRNGVEISGVFVEGARYLAVITMETLDLYRFSAAYPFMYPNGAVAIQPAPGILDVGKRVLSVTYHETKAPLTITSKQDLALYIAPPGTGATAILSFAGTGYTGTAEWKVLSGSAWEAMTDTRFKPGAAYQTEVTVYPAAGYILDGAVFTHSGGTVGNAGSLTESGVYSGMIIAFPVTAIEAVSDFNLTSKVPQPVMSGTPVGYFSAPQYTGTVEWTVTDSGAVVSDIFAATTKYTAKASLTAVSGWTFTGAALNGFDYAGASAVKALYNTGDTITVIIEFPATGSVPPVPVDDLDLTEKVPRPVRGGTPVGWFSAPQYTGAAVWTQTAGGVPVNGLFAADTSYTATVTLTAASGRTFFGAAASAFTYKDASVTVGYNTGSGVTVIITFSSGSVPAAPVYDLNLTGKVPRPIMSGTPTGWFSAAQYTGAVEWETTGGAAHSGLFQPDTKYTARVTLTAASGWTFGSLLPSFTHDGVSLADVSAAHDNGNGTITVTIDFDVTDNVPSVPVDDLDLTSWVPKPVRGGVPVRWFSAPQYTGSVVWTATTGKVDGLFQQGTAYTATVTLLAASGRIFDGGTVSHAGADGVTADTTNPSSTITVTIDFQKTTNVEAVPVEEIERDLTMRVPTPVMNGTPVGWFSAPQYMGSVEWTATTSGAPVKDALFAADTFYTAKVTLTAASGYTFNKAGDFSHKGALPQGGVSTDSNNDGTVVTIKFPATGHVPVSVVDDPDLTKRVPRPEMSGVLVRWFSASQYTGEVVWTPTSSSGLFAAVTQYTAEVTLRAASGWTFGSPVLSFNHGGVSQGNVSAERIDGGTVRVTITFPTTGSVPVKKVDDLTLTNRVPKPVTGKQPILNVITSQYWGEVVWSPPGHEVFQIGVDYTATVTLTALSGYTFNGVGDGAGEEPFTHGSASDVTTVTNAAESGTVTLTFPKAGDLGSVKVPDTDWGNNH